MSAIFECKFGPNGLELTEEQIQECRDYAIAELLSNHEIEYNSMFRAHIERKYEFIKSCLADMGISNTEGYKQ